MKYIFPVSFMANTFAMTAVMIALSLAGKPDVAADVGIVHAVTVALFHSFSANARSIILNPSSGIPAASVLSVRLLLLVPLGVLSFLLSTNLAGVEVLLAFVLVLRRGVEWIAEVRVSEMEQRNETKPASVFLALQIILTSFVFIWMLADLPFLLLVMIVWATSPIWFSAKFILECAYTRPLIHGPWLRQLPHFGSTAVIGISVYVFRLLILLLTGKAIAGDLYAAFAIGGILGSVFAQAIGPTLVLQEVRGRETRFPAWLTAVLGLAVLVGTTLVVMATVSPDQLLWTGKSGFFWMATGLSLIGGVVMVAAQRIRLRLLQHHTDNDVFGPDVVVNILLVGSVPYLFYLFSMDALTYMYLLSSVLGVILYYSAAKGENLWAKKIRSWDEPIKGTIALLLLVPIFFQLNGTIFRESIFNFDTGGHLTRLPIPVSVLACYGGIVLLGGFARAHMPLTVIFFTFVLMVASSVLLTHEQGRQEQAKLILLIQFVLPIFALVLGRMFVATDDAKYILARVFLYALAALVPAQLAVTWLRGEILLSPYLYIFSVYQLYEYVSVMFAAAYLISLFSLWDVHRYWTGLLALSIPLGIFVAASMSTLAIVALLAGVLSFAAYRKVCGWGNGRVLILCLMTLLSVFSYLSIVANTGAFADKYRQVTVEAMESPRNVAQRINYWKFYVREVFGNIKSTAFGHAEPPDRMRYPSAHNYYLDFAYNFGIVALLPLLGLITFTVLSVYENRGRLALSPPLFGLASVVLFLILVENFFKVGMRQPYPGILTFFLWGVLLAELSRRSMHTGKASPA